MHSNKKRISRIAVKTGASGVGHIIMLVLKIIGTMLLIFMTTGVIFACIFAIYIKTNLMTGLDVTLEDFSLNQTSIVYSMDDTTGEYVAIAELQGSENRTWIDYSDIPINVEHAVVAIEDKRFYEHNGVDWFRTVYAFFNMFLSMRDTFGGSTLTQQLIKNLTEDDEVTVQRKLMEIFRALELEKTYSKSDIMEWYLNVAYFGSGQYGIVAAANYYFGKDVSELSIAEIASIISITNNPSIFSPYVSVEDNKDRQEDVLYEMYDQGYITYEEYTAAMNEQLVFDQGEDEETDVSSVYSYFVDALIEDVIDDLMEVKGCSYDIAEQLLFNGGYKIYTTMDMGIQAIVDSYYEDVTNFETDSTQQLQSAIVISDPYTGDIVALSGGVGEKTQNRILNRATQSTRPVGSTIKPLSVYSPAMDLGYITPDTNIDDSEDVKLTGTTWMTTNDTNTYSGIINIREALRRSVNTVAAQLVDKLTPQVSYNFMIDKLGFTTLVEEDCDYAPMALGQLTNGATAREMAAGYGIFDNSGIYTESRLYSLITDADGITVFENVPSTNIAISEVTAYWMTDMLEGVVSSGTGTAADLENMPTAGKTGSTTSYYDRWFVGFTPYYVAAVWVGYDNPERISWSGNPAAQTFYTVMSQVHANLEYRDFTVPANTYQTPVEGVKAVNYTVKGVTKDGVVLYETTTLSAVGKEIEITAQPVTGYVLISESPLVKLTVNMNAESNIVTFVYQDENYVEPTPSPSPTPTTTVTPTPTPTPSATPSTSPTTPSAKP